MDIELKPDLARFIEEQVRTGKFDSPEAAINAAIARVRIEEELLSEEMDESDLAAIEEGLTQANRGEVRRWAVVREELRAEHLNK